MMVSKILILGATGMLGQPVVRQLVENGHQVRVMGRDAEKMRKLYGDAVEILAGDAANREDIRNALTGCHAVHINLPPDVELVAAEHVINLAAHNQLQRITYVSATTAFEQNRWYELVDVKLRSEEIIRRSGIPVVVLCPTWAMETLFNFIHGKRAAVIMGKNPPALHFFAAKDFGRIAAATYQDDRALGKRLFIHGPEAITLPDALERFIETCYPECTVTRWKLWQAQMFATLTMRKDLKYAIELIAYFDQVGELGDPTETNDLFGAPAITLDQWLKL